MKLRTACGLLPSLVLAGCSLARFAESPEGQPVYVLGNPACVLGCASDLGTVRGSGELHQSAEVPGRQRRDDR